MKYVNASILVGGWRGLWVSSIKFYVFIGIVEGKLEWLWWGGEVVVDSKSKGKVPRIKYSIATAFFLYTYLIFIEQKESVLIETETVFLNGEKKQFV